MHWLHKWISNTSLNDMKKNFYKFIRIAASGLLLGFVSTASAFTAGNLVLNRVGNGKISLSSAANPLSLSEFTTAGVVVGSTVSIPIFASGSNNQGGFTDSGTATSNGLMPPSADGQFLTFSRIDAQLGTASVTGTTSLVANRNIALIYSTDAVKLVAWLTDAFTSKTARSAVTESGTRYTKKVPTDGARYVASASDPTTSNQLASGNLCTIKKIHDFFIIFIALGAEKCNFFSERHGCCLVTCR
jgi:hypothetical protein